MSNEENYVNDNTDQLGKIGDNNIQAKESYMAKKKEIKAASTLSDQDQRILALVKEGRPIDRICAQYMVHKSYVDALVEKHK